MAAHPTLITSIFLFTLVFLGGYLLFYKRKSTNENQVMDWLDTLNLSSSAKNIRLKEINKQTEKMFTPKWFLEYWQGKRSALSAWLTWVFLGQIIIGLVSMLSILNISQKASRELESFIPFLIFAITYKVFASIILWRCAINSTPFYKYFARFIAVFNILSVLGMIK